MDGVDKIQALHSIYLAAILIGWPLVLGSAAKVSQDVARMITILTAEPRRIISVTGCKNRERWLLNN